MKKVWVHLSTRSLKGKCAAAFVIGFSAALGFGTAILLASGIGSKITLKQIQADPVASVIVTLADGTVIQGPSTLITGGPSGLLNCADFGPGVCDIDLVAMAQHFIDWQGTQGFHQVIMSGIADPSAVPLPGTAYLYFNPNDKKLHLKDENGLNTAFP